MTNQKKQQLQKIYQKLLKHNTHSIACLESIRGKAAWSEHVTRGYFYEMTYLYGLGLIKELDRRMRLLNGSPIAFTELGKELIKYIDEQENIERKNKLVESYYEEDSKSEPDLQGILDKLYEREVLTLQNRWKGILDISAPDSIERLISLGLLESIHSKSNQFTKITLLGAQLLDFINEKEKSQEKPLPKASIRWKEISVQQMHKDFHDEIKRNAQAGFAPDPMQELLNEWDGLSYDLQRELIAWTYPLKSYEKREFLDDAQWANERTNLIDPLKKSGFIEIYHENPDDFTVSIIMKPTSKCRLMLELVRIRQELQDEK